MYAYVLVNDDHCAINVFVIPSIKREGETLEAARRAKIGWNRINPRNYWIVAATREEVYKSDYTNCRRVG